VIVGILQFSDRAASVDKEDNQAAVGIFPARAQDTEQKDAGYNRNCDDCHKSKAARIGAEYRQV
jgi:hypothetical protein